MVTLHGDAVGVLQGSVNAAPGRGGLRLLRSATPRRFPPSCRRAAGGGRCWVPVRGGGHPAGSARGVSARARRPGPAPAARGQAGESGGDREPCRVPGSARSCLSPFSEGSFAEQEKSCARLRQAGAAASSLRHGTRTGGWTDGAGEHGSGSRDTPGTSPRRQSERRRREASRLSACSQRQERSRTGCRGARRGRATPAPQPASFSGRI